MLLDVFQRFAKPLEMHNFTFPQELERVADIRVVNQPEQIIVAEPGFLFWYACIRTNLSEK